MRIGGPTPAAAWVPLRLAQQTLVQTAGHASLPTAQRVTAPDRIEQRPAPRPILRGVLDVRV